MKIITDPKVTMIARQVFFGHPDYKIPADGNDAVKIGAFAAKGCYASFSENGRSNEENQLAILGHQHGCYDGETQVLTADGWKNWPDVTMNDLLATRTSEGVLEYHRPIRLISYFHSGKMYKVTGISDLLVTPDHKMLACKTTTLEGRKNITFSLITAEELGHSSYRMTKTAEWVSNNSNPDLNYNVMALLGFTIGDGHVPSNSGPIVSFNLRRERKITWLFDIIGKLGWTYKTDSNRHRTEVRIPSNLIGLFRSIYDANKEKVIPQHLFTSVDKDSLKGLYEGLIESDGHKGRTGVSFDSTSQTLIGQIQQLCLHIGISANIGYTVSKEQRNSFGSKPLTRLHINTRNNNPHINKYAGSKTKSTWVDNWQGQVYCAEVPNNTLFVRRGGIPVWSGNSVTEHINFTFFVEGITRALSLESNRHRNFAVSQRSTRYTAEEGAAIVLEPFYAKIYREHRDSIGKVDGFWFTDMHKSPDIKKIQLLVDYLNASNQALIAYNKQVEALMEMNPNNLTGFDLRKWARGKARNLLPHGLETQITYTVNVRGLRWFIESRSERHAEPEIRRLADVWLQEVRKIAPLYFEDFEISQVYDGIPEWVAKYKKV